MSAPTASNYKAAELSLPLSDILEVYNDSNNKQKALLHSAHATTPNVQRKTRASLQTCAGDALAIITSFLSSSSTQAAFLRTCKCVRAELKTRIIWAYFQTHGIDIKKRPQFGRIRIVQLIGDAARLPIDATSGQPLPVYELRIMLGRETNPPIQVWPRGLKVLTIERVKDFQAWRSRRNMLHIPPAPLWPTFNEMAPAGLHTLKVYDCPLYNQPAPEGTHTLKIFNCVAYNQPPPAGIREFQIADCDSYNQPAPAGTLTLGICACSAYNQAVPESLQTCKIVNCLRFNQSVPAGIPISKVTGCPNYLGDKM